MRVDAKKMPNAPRDFFVNAADRCGAVLPMHGALAFDAAVVENYAHETTAINTEPPVFKFTNCTCPQIQVLCFERKLYA